VKRSRKMRVEPKRQSPHAMYLRQELVNGEVEVNGVKREIELSMSGTGLILTVGAFSDPDRVVETIGLKDLTAAWIDSVVESMRQQEPEGENSDGRPLG
jgi:hypothetical protein